MKIAGIIAEYNPFHRGHAWHIAETRRLTGCDYVIVCMDGHFTQRGEPAMCSKWARTRAALSCGADAVFELPTLYAVRTADAFARGGVAILGGLGTDILSFGCEVADADLVLKLAQLRDNEPTSVSETIAEKLKQGHSHARAQGEAIAEYLGLSSALLNQPNLTLATEYARANARYHTEMSLCPVLRRGEYHDENLSAMSSAAAIRAAFQRGEYEAALGGLPEAARPFGVPDAMHAMDDLLLFRLRSMSLEDMRRLPDVSEGLEQRLYKHCRLHSTRADLLAALKCKRYTHARLSRLLTHALLGMTQTELEAHPMPTYARLLGIRRGAAPLLSELKSRATIDIAASTRLIREDPVFMLENRATDIWALLHDRAEERLPGRELTERFITV